MNTRFVPKAHLLPKFDIAAAREIPECKKFLDWYSNSMPYDNFVYYTGLTLQSGINSIRLRQLTWFYATKGWVYLLQRKLDINMYDFIAQKSLHRYPKLIPVDDRRNGKVT